MLKTYIYEGKLATEKQPDHDAVEKTLRELETADAQP